MSGNLKFYASILALTGLVISFCGYPNSRFLNPDQKETAPLAKIPQKKELSHAFNNQIEYFLVSSDNAVIDPVTLTATIASAAKLFIGFFSSNDGPSIIDFIRNTNEQLSIVNSKIDVVLNDLDEIKLKLDNTPSKVVAKIKQVELKGRINEYIGIMTGIGGNAYKGNIALYMREKANADHINLLVNDIRRIKADLEAIDYDPFTVPFVTIAMNMEYYMRLNFLKESSASVAGSMAVDQTWLRKSLFTNSRSLQNILTELVNARENALFNFQQQIYLIQYDWSRWERDVGTSGISYYGFQVGLSIDIDKSVVEDSTVLLLRKIGILKERDAPLILSPSSDRVLINGSSKMASKIEAVTNEKNLQEAVQNVKMAKLREYNEYLRQNYLELITIATSYYAGLKALEVCNIYLRAAGIKQK